MPQEFLRDVLRTGDAAQRRQRHWSVLPLSIAGHAVVLTVFLFSPWLREADLPVIASPLPGFIPTIAPSPPPPPAPRALAPADTSKAPIVAPSDITPEQPRSSSRDNIDGLIPDGPEVASGPPLLGPLGVAEAVVPPPPPIPPPPKLLHVGGRIREPRKIFHVAPLYPEFARQARAEGPVIIEAILDATGRVESVRVLRSQPLLDEAALRAVRQWRYTPTELNGVPVPVLMTITVWFSLER